MFGLNRCITSNIRSVSLQSASTASTRLKWRSATISRSIWKYAGKATVDGQVAAEAELMCTLREIEPVNGNGNGAAPGAA